MTHHDLIAQRAAEREKQRTGAYEVEVTTNGTVPITGEDDRMDAWRWREGGERDALRYRKLRDHTSWPSGNDAARCMRFDENGCADFLSGDRLDRAVDKLP